MVGDRGAIELLELVSRRQKLLCRLAMAPVEAAALAAELDPTRSTIDRGLAELNAAGLVERVDEGYQTTMAGELALSEFDRLVDRMEAITVARPLLGLLPGETPIDPRLLDGATMILADTAAQKRQSSENNAVASRSIDPMTALTAVFEHGAHHRIYAPALQPALVDPCIETICDGGSATIALTSDATSALLGTFSDATREAIKTGRLTLFETSTQLPYALIVTEFNGDHDDMPFSPGPDTDTLTLVVVCKEGTIRGILANDRPAAIEWATTTLTTIRANAHELAFATDAD